MGVSFSPTKYGNTKIVMYYTSMHRAVPRLLLGGIRKLHASYGKGLQVGLGVLDVGILGNEPKITPEELRRDLEEMRKIGVSEVVLFRLSGMNAKYLKVLKEFL